MSWREEYELKQMSPEEVVSRFIPSGSVCFMSGLHVADDILRELLDCVKAGTREGITLVGCSASEDFGFREQFFPEDQFRYHALFSMWHERVSIGKSVTHVPVHFGEAEEVIEAYHPDIAVIQVTEPDENGYVNFGPLGLSQSGAPYCKKFVGQVNKHMPYVYGSNNCMHVSQFEAFAIKNEELYHIPEISPTVEEAAVAQQVAQYIHDGDTIQVGIGGMGTAICKALTDKKHLGCFSEMYSLELARLQQMGVIDNSLKNFMPGKSIAGYSEGSLELYDYIDHNPEVYFLSYSQMCNPLFIAQNDNLVSVNQALSIDLTGQVCAESIGPRQFSATGGQVGFVLGAKYSKGGRSFICMTSVAHTKNGPISKITPLLAQGSAVTTLRNDVQYVATEYGCVNLRYVDVATRAKRLISIAHPDFRDQLTFEARKLGYIF